MGRRVLVAATVVIAALGALACRRVNRGAGKAAGARADAGAQARAQGRIALPGAGRARVLALAPGRAELALVVWSNDAGLWASTASETQRLADADATAVAAWDGKRTHIISAQARLVLGSDGSVVTRGAGVPGTPHLAFAGPEGLVVVRERCATTTRPRCARFVDVSLDHGATWLAEQALALHDGEPLVQVVGFLDAGRPAWLESSLPTAARRVDPTGRVSTLGEVPYWGPPMRAAYTDDRAWWVRSVAPLMAVCPGSPARLVLAPQHGGGAARFGTLAELTAGRGVELEAAAGRVPELVCQGDELVLATGAGTQGGFGASPLRVLVSHDGGKRWLEEPPLPEALSNLAHLGGVPPRAQLYFGQVSDEDRRRDSAGLPPEGDLLVRGGLYRVTQSDTGFGGVPRALGIPDLSQATAGVDSKTFDLESWRVLTLPSGATLVVWVELEQPREQTRLLTGVAWLQFE